MPPTKAATPRRAPAKNPAAAAAKKAPPAPEAATQMPFTPPVRVEIRLNGKLSFADTCYGVRLHINDAGEVTFSGSKQPVLVAAPPPPPARPPERFGSDPRDGEEVINRVHSGRLDR